MQNILFNVKVNSGVTKFGELRQPFLNIPLTKALGFEKGFFMQIPIVPSNVLTGSSSLEIFWRFTPYWKEVMIDNNKLTAIQEYQLSCNCYSVFENFSILTTASNDFEFKITKSLLIERDKFVLNKANTPRAIFFRSLSHCVYVIVFIQFLILCYRPHEFVVSIKYHIQKCFQKPAKYLRWSVLPKKLKANTRKVFPQNASS